ncbi:MAG: heavy metal-associated domain-containing protein [candidate division WOR-3 bacterium]|jgi:copper chaperone CopZ
MRKYKMLIEGMDCEGCVRTVKKTIESFGAKNVNVSLEEKFAEFEIENANIKEIEEAINKKGYEVKDIKEV